MFRLIISSILRSTRLCLQPVVERTDGAACRKHGEVIEIINKLLLLHLFVIYIIVSMMYGHTNIRK